MQRFHMFIRPAALTAVACVLIVPAGLALGNDGDGPRSVKIVRVADGHDGSHASTIEVREKGGTYQRRVIRDGTTYLLVTRAPLSDAQVDERITRVDRELPVPPAPLAPPVPGAAPVPPVPPAPTVMLIRADKANCKDGGGDTLVRSDRDGERREVRVHVCGVDAVGMAHALSGLREARADLAKDVAVPADARTRALEAIDRAIAQLEAKSS